MNNYSPQFLIVFSIFVFLFTSCSPQAASPPQVIQESTPTRPTNSSVEIITSTPAPAGVQIGDSVPLALREQITSLDLPASARVYLDISSSIQSDSAQTKIQWIYAVVAPFPTVKDGLTLDELHLAWTEGTAPTPFGGIPLLMDQATLAAFTTLWDSPAAGSVRVVPPDQLLDLAWAESHSWAIIPFESLEPRWKVLTVDGQSPIRKGFDISSYPLIVDFALQTSEDLQSSNSTISQEAVTNYDPSKLTTVILTGVTAMVRATAYTMELKGATYPGEKIRDLMREADIAHISNEIPFFTGCTFPKPDAGALVFCSDPKYMDLLTDIGTDVVELTGNHFADRGSAGMLETIAIYNANELPYFGGGMNLQDSLKPALFEVNGNKIAFIGCNKPDVGRFP
ncbi:MAG TPA: CapA family protein, partial [Anaerolineales bacterium]|nr:CapA family protein [Anaerolineales bacterium]